MNKNFCSVKSTQKIELYQIVSIFSISMEFYLVNNRILFFPKIRLYPLFFPLEPYVHKVEYLEIAYPIFYATMLNPYGICYTVK
jgi:hypothetical protein